MSTIVMQPSGRGYDHGGSTFSPDGRLYQVEYARESVKRGTTTVGIKFKKGVVLIVDKRLSSKLIEADSIEKIFKIDEIVISANKWEQSKSDISSQILDLSENEIRYLNPETSAELLEKTGQIFVQKSQLGGGSPMIRGFEA